MDNKRCSFHPIVIDNIIIWFKKGREQVGMHKNIADGLTKQTKMRSG